MPDTEIHQKPTSSLLQSLETFILHQSKPMWIEDLSNHTFLAVNRAALVLSGFTEREFLNKKVDEILVEEAPPLFRENGNANENLLGSLCTYRLSRKDDSAIEMELSYHKIRDENLSAAALVTAQEITLQKTPNRLSKTLGRAALKMEQALAPDEIFKTVAQELNNEGYISILFLYDEQQGILFPRFLNYDSRKNQLTEKLVEVHQEDFSIPLNETSYFQQVIFDHEIVFLEDVQKVIQKWLPNSWNNLSNPMAGIWQASKAILAPLTVENKTIGSFSISSSDLSVDDILAVTAFSRLLAAAWQRANLYSRMQAELFRQQRIEQSLRESGEKFRLLTDSSISGIYLIQNGKFSFVNQAFASIFGYPVDEIIEKIEPMDLVCSEDRAKVLQNIQIGLDGDQPIELNDFFQGYRKDGSLIQVETHARRIEIGGQVGLIGSLLDVTQKISTEKALRQREEQLRSIIEQVPTVIYTESATDQGLLFISPQVETLSGYTQAEWMSKPEFWKDLVHPDDLNRVVDIDNETAQNGKPFREEYRIISRNGNTKWIYDEAILICDKDGHPLYWQGVMLDISEAKQHEQEVEALVQLSSVLSESLDLHSLLEWILKAAMQAIPASEKGTILLADKEGKLKIEAMVGYTDQRVLTASFPLEEGYSAQAFRQRRARVINNAKGNDPSQYRGDIAEIAGVQSAVVVPLIVDNQAIGVISLDNASRKEAFTRYDLRLLENFAATAALVIERARFYEEIERRSAQNSALNTILIAASHDSTDIETLLQISLDQLIKTLNVSMGAIWIPKAHFGKSYLVTNNLPSGINQTMQRVTYDYQMDLSEVQVTNLNSDNTNPIFTTLKNQYGIQAALVVPLLTRGKRIGSIAVASSQPYQWNEDEIHLLETLGRQLGLLIERAQGFAETQKNLSRLETIYDVSLSLRKAQSVEEALPLFLDKTLEVLHTSSGSIMLYDPQDDTLKRTAARGWLNGIVEVFQPSKEGIAGLVFNNGKSYLIQDYSDDPLVYQPVEGRIPTGWGGVCVPIRTTTKPLGVIFISIQQPRQITMDEIALLESLADIASSAIQRMSLYEETLRQVERLSTLREIDRLIISSFDFHFIFKNTLPHIIRSLHVDAANIFIYHPDMNMLEQIADYGFFSHAQPKRYLQLGECLAGRAAIERSALFIPDLKDQASEPAIRTFYEGEYFKSYYAFSMIDKGELKGVLEVFSRHVLNPDQDWLRFLETLAGQLLIAMGNTRLFEDLQRSNQDLFRAYDATIEGWARALDMRDKETEGHTRRVTELVTQLADLYGVDQLELVHIRRGAILHDIGKMAIPDKILLKPGPLTEEEWETMRKHPQFAYDMLSSIGYLKPALDIPYCHHEKWDGTGYPRQLKGEQIPLEARLFSIVDVYDALTSDRPYRKAWTKTEAIHYIRQQCGQHFDPQVVELFLKMLVVNSDLP